ncbi:transposase [Clostridioides difficile]
MEFDDHLGYDNKGKDTKNSRDGYKNKNIKSNTGEITLNILKNRNEDFEIKLIKNYKNRKSMKINLLFLK